MIKFPVAKEQKYIRFLLLNLLLILPLVLTSDIISELQLFGLRLFHELCDEEPKNDQLLAPFSLATILILLQLNAKNESAYEIADNLGLKGETLEDIQAIYLEQLKAMENGHIFTMSNHISIVSREVDNENFDLKPIDTVSAWSNIDICNISSNFAIPDFETHILLATEVHFKNLFLYNFASTAKRPFYTIDGRELPTDTMALLANLHYGEIPEIKAKAVEIPYSDGETSLVIILPNVRGRINELQKDLKLFPVTRIASFLTQQWVTVVLPKLRSKMDGSLKEELKRLGMSSMFEQLCNGEYKIRVEDVIYTASFYINEKASGLDPFVGQDTYNFTPDNVTEFHINHPFIFLIKSSSNVIYLSGKMMKYYVN